MSFQTCKTLNILKNDSNQTVLVTSGFYYAEGKKTIKKVMEG